MEKLRGVNLGNWLVLEKWISEALFSGTTAMDETYLCLELGHERAAERLKVHRDEFITERDFEDIAAKGFNAVRIPVPFFLFEDMGPYIHCYEYLDRAFDWAEKFGLKILVDLHTAPGGHNGTDNSGICGICTWSTRPRYVELTVEVLEKIARRYGRREALWGIGVLNEPMCSDTKAEYPQFRTVLYSRGQGAGKEQRKLYAGISQEVLSGRLCRRPPPHGQIRCLCRRL